MKRIFFCLFTFLFYLLILPANASLLKVSTARNLAVFMVDSTDNVTGKTGLTLTITSSKAGAAFASITPTVTELANGWYSLALTSGHTDTLGDFALHITGTGANANDEKHDVVTDLPGATVSSVTGAVGSVTGAVGSVTGNVGGNVVGSTASVSGAVGSVTGNVGGNVVGSVASVSGAVGSVTGNVGGNVVGSVASVSGNVSGSVASVVGAVGSVTGNVGGNVTGSTASVSGAVGSVTGAVGSVTGNVGGNVVGSVASVTSGVTVTTNNDKTGYSLVASSIPIKKNTALSNFQFPMLSSTTGLPVTGLTVSCQRSLDGAAFASCANSVTELSNGYYKVNFAAGDMNGNTVAVRLYGTGAKEKSITFVTQ